MKLNENIYDDDSDGDKHDEVLDNEPEIFPPITVLETDGTSEEDFVREYETLERNFSSLIDSTLGINVLEITDSCF